MVDEVQQGQHDRPVGALVVGQVERIRRDDGRQVPKLSQSWKGNGGCFPSGSSSRSSAGFPQGGRASLNRLAEVDAPDPRDLVASELGLERKRERERVERRGESF